MLLWYLILTSLLVALAIQWYAHRQVHQTLNNAVHMHYGIQQTKENREQALRLYYRLRERAPERYQPLIDHGINDILHVPQIALVDNPFIGDAQNVHDPMVVQSVKQTLDNTRAPLPLAFNDAPWTQKLRDEIKTSDFSESDKQKMMQTMAAMEKNNTYIERYEAHEIDILKKMYLEADTNPKKSDYLRNLLLGLRDSHEHGHVVCAMGRASHVISANHPENIKSTGIIKQEMNLKAAKIMHDDPDDFDTQIRQVFYKDYVEPGILTQAQVDAELQSWDL